MNNSIRCCIILQINISTRFCFILFLFLPYFVPCYDYLMELESLQVANNEEPEARICYKWPFLRRIEGNVSKNEQRCIIETAVGSRQQDPRNSVWIFRQICGLCANIYHSLADRHRRHHGDTWSGSTQKFKELNREQERLHKRGVPQRHIHRTMHNGQNRNQLILRRVI